MLFQLVKGEQMLQHHIQHDHNYILSVQNCNPELQIKPFHINTSESKDKVFQNNIMPANLVLFQLVPMMVAVLLQWNLNSS